MVPLHKWNCETIMHIDQAQTEISGKRSDSCQYTHQYYQIRRNQNAVTEEDLLQGRQIPISFACHNENRTVGVISGTSF